MSVWIQATQTNERQYFSIVSKSNGIIQPEKKVCCIFFDIAAAFDKVWHNGLIFKLTQMNLPLYLVNCFTAFLWERKFRVSLDGFVTEEFNIITGVPQGAVLSSILFSIFINDIPTNNLKNKTYSQLFADDLSYLYIYLKGEATASLKINKHLRYLGFAY